MKVIRILLIAGLVLVLAAVAFWIWLTYPMPRERERVSLPTNTVWLDTGLSEKERVLWHHLPEGSEAVPMSVLEALKSPRTGKQFLLSLAEYGFLLESEDPHKLPVGWAMEIKELGGRLVPYVGINCAGCHSGELRYQGRSIRIDGAPNLVQLEAFFLDLRDAISAVQSNRLDTLLFLREVIRRNHVLRGEGEFLNISHQALVHLESVDEAEATTPPVIRRPPPFRTTPTSHLRRASTNTTATGDFFSELIASISRDGSYLQRRLHNVQVLSTAIDSGVDLGPGRGDSFGIIRRLLWPFDRLDLDAPVSTPHLFNFGRYGWIHWDGNTRSVMQRNVAQAIALGADFDHATYQSSALIFNLHKLELIGRKLKAPAWPEEILGAIDRPRAERGKAHFNKLCLDCHNGEQIYPVEQIGTSPVRATNFALPIAGRDFPTALANIAAFAEKALLLQHNVTAEQAHKLEIPHPDWRATRGYVARTLGGVWATAPYLHNGSVPTLYDLLQPAARRPAKFPVGHRDYDPKKLGYVTDVANPIFTVDTTIDGNHNSGHEFGTELSDDEKWELLEYLKTL